MKLLLLSLLFTSAFSLPNKDVFDNFVKDYSKSYSDENEYNNRFEIFMDNYNFVKEHNSRNDTKYQLGINIDPDDKNIDIKLGMLEDEKYLEKIYSNISEVNNHFANVDLVVKQYMELI